MTHGLFTMTHGKKSLKWCSKNDSQEAWGRIGVPENIYWVTYTRQHYWGHYSKMEKLCSAHDFQRTGRQQKISPKTGKWIARKVQQNHSQTVQEFRRTCSKQGLQERSVTVYIVNIYLFIYIYICIWIIQKQIIYPSMYICLQ